MLILYLTKEEEALLNGERGEILAMAIKTIVKVGEVLGAERLVQIKHAHISGISYFNVRDSGLEFIESLANRGAKFAVFTTCNPYAVMIDEKMPEDIANKQERIVVALRKMGSLAFTCAPYYVRRPKYGEHLAWAESNAVLYANSLLGARSNREGGPLALLEALVGRTYLAGAHLDDGRTPKCLVELDKAPNNTVLTTYLGLKVGELCPDRIPLVRGLQPLPEGWLKLFLASFGATSNAPMVVFEGITPDYKTLSAKADVEDKHIVKIADVERELNKNLGKPLRSEGRVVYFIGCPHLSLEELKHVRNLMKSELRSINSNTNKQLEFWVGIGDNVSLEDPIVKDLESMGVRILRGMCPVTTDLRLLGIDFVVIDSGKALFYMPKLAKVNVVIKDRNELISEYLRCSAFEK